MQIKKQIILMILTGVLLTSCSGQATGEPTVDVNAVASSIVGTFSVALTQTHAAQPTASATPTLSVTPTTPLVDLNALTPLATSTRSLSTVFFPPTPTGTQYTPTVDPSGLASGCNNLLLIDDVTIPAGTELEPEQTFTKTWKVANTGTCDWVYLYRLVFVSGERMGGVSSGLGKVIEPGKWTQLSVGLQAPSDPGTYTGYWRFGNQSGAVFGSTLTVSIVVASATAVPPTDTDVPPTNTVAPTATPTATATPTP